MRLKERVAIVTGGGSGIGKAIALAFASEGAAVIVASRTLSHLEEVAGEIQLKGGKAKAIEADISDEEQVRSLVAQTLSEYGKIDILVNNSAAPVGVDYNVVDMDLKEWNRILSVNLTGTMLCSKEVLKDMIPRKSGNIINISSFAGVSGSPQRSSYCASKWGVIGLTETLAIEVGEYNIRVNSICPAATDSERFQNAVKLRAASLGMTYEEMMGKMLAQYSLKRIANALEIATVAVCLASDDFSAVTGQNIIVSCGFHILNSSEIK
jgi:NAD(P)-dependent dehydrogenase (short-subunit alcohol dehydrogenase family)